MSRTKFKKEYLKLALKLLVGIAVIIYVLRSKMVDFEKLGSVLWNPVNFLMGFLFLAGVVLLSAARWRLLVRAQGLSLSYGHLVELTMIGQFFNTFMPGAVGGDLMKAWYVAGREPQRKTKAIFTVLFDRMIGLSVIIFYSATTLLFYTEWMGNTPELLLLAYAIWGFTLVSGLVGLVFFASLFWKFPWAEQMKTILHRNKHLSKLTDAFFLYRHHGRSILLALAISALSVLCMNLMYKFQGDALGIPLDLPHYFFIVPLALTASAIPLLPGGFGVGQVAFYNLFKWVGVANPDQGGTLCTLIQIYTLLFNCLGAFFYFRFKRNPAGCAPTPEEEAALSRAGMTFTAESPTT